MNDTNMFNFSTFPILTTERLTLRQLQLSDANDVLVFRGDREVQKYNGSLLYDVTEVQAFIKELQAEYANQEGIHWGVTLTNCDTVIGLFSLYHWSKHHRRAETGYDLVHTYWGQGIASKVLRTIIPFGFNRMNLHRIYATTIADNHESIRLLERLGFQREGTRRQSSWEDDGAFHDSALYGLLRHEWTFSFGGGVGT